MKLSAPTSPDIPLIQIVNDFKSEAKLPWTLIDNKPYIPTLGKSINTNFAAPQARNLKSRRIIGLDEAPSEYWFNNRIHTFGNAGIFGRVHASLAPLATQIIDNKAYDGVDVRNHISKELYQVVNKANARVLDMCCGVGMSTQALSTAFHDAEVVLGIDTSPEMISTARSLSKHANAVSRLLQKWRGQHIFKRLLKNILILHGLKNFSKTVNSHTSFARGNAERLKLPKESFDLVTVMYAFHEIPKSARYRILREARRLLKQGGALAIIDISPDYKPSATMLAGEPYVLEYKQNIQKQMSRFPGFDGSYFKSIVPGHVRMWLLTERKIQK